MSLEDKTKSWYNQPKSNLMFSILPGKYSKIRVSSAPMMDGLTLEQAKSVDHYVNISASEFEMNSYNKELNSQFHWFPLSEMGFWGFPTLYGFFKTMDKIHTPENKIVVHCEAGCNRSPTMTYAWLLYREKTLKSANLYVPENYNWEQNLKGNIEQGHIPSINNLKYFNSLVRNKTSLENISINEYLEKYTMGIIPGLK